MKKKQRRKQKKTSGQFSSICLGLYLAVLVQVARGELPTEKIRETLVGMQNLEGLDPVAAEMLVSMFDYAYAGAERGPAGIRDMASVSRDLLSNEEIKWQ